jgi:hypothetical protein
MLTEHAILYYMDSPRGRRVAPAKEVVQYQGDAHEFWQQAAD